MHLVFSLYGQKERVDRLLHWLETTMFPFKFIPQSGELEGKEQTTMVQGCVRYGMLGTWEFIIPEPMKDIVMTYLRFDQNIRSDQKLGQGMKLAAMRKALNCEPVPEFKKDMLWTQMPREFTEFISIVPIGVRYDKYGITDNYDGLPKNWQERL